MRERIVGNEPKKIKRVLQVLNTGSHSKVFEQESDMITLAIEL
jgi:hypothetical protein